MEKRWIRIKFSKLGEIKYISHLDLARTFMRALRRARIPLWFSEGFNPHPKLNFALPLSVGAESECELCDIAVPADAPEGCMEPLKNQLPSGIRLLEIEDSPTKKFSLVEFALYRLELPHAAFLQEAFWNRLQQPMPVTKKGKKGESTVEVSAMIAEKELLTEGDSLILKLLLPAGGEQGYCNPELLLKALGEEEAFAPACENCRILRQAVFDKNRKPF